MTTRTGRGVFQKARDDKIQQPRPAGTEPTIHSSRGDAEGILQRDDELHTPLNGEVEGRFNTGVPIGLVLFAPMCLLFSMLAIGIMLVKSFSSFRG